MLNKICFLCALCFLSGCNDFIIRETKRVNFQKPDGSQETRYLQKIDMCDAKSRTCSESKTILTPEQKYNNLFTGAYMQKFFSDEWPTDQALCSGTTN